MAIAVSKLLDAVIATGAGASIVLDAPSYLANSSAKMAFQAVLSGTGALTATVLVQVSNDAINWMTLGTITLSGTTLTSDGFTAEAPWAYVRGNVTAISGTGATITLHRSLLR